MLVNLTNCMVVRDEACVPLKNRQQQILERLLEPYKPTFADKIPAQYKDPQDRWYGEMLLSEVSMYNSQALKPEEVPQDWDVLLDPKQGAV